MIATQTRPSPAPIPSRPAVRGAPAVGAVPLTCFLPLLQEIADARSRQAVAFLDSVLGGLDAGLDPDHFVTSLPSAMLGFVAGFYNDVDRAFPLRRQAGVRNQARGFVLSLYRPAEAQLVQAMRGAVTSQAVIDIVAAFQPLARLQPRGGAGSDRSHT